MSRPGSITRRALLQAAAVATLYPAAASAQPLKHRDAALRIAQGVVTPGLDVLAKATAEQAAAWHAFERSPSAAGLATLKTAFQSAADAWSAIESIRFGPISQDLRYERMAHWPERKNAVDKALAGLLARAEPITPERLRRASVAGQGLSALERLLFGDREGDAAMAGRDLLDRSPLGERRRALGTAIADGVARMVTETVSGWADPDGQLARLERMDPGEARQALTALVTEHLAILEAVQDAKIGAVLGRNLDEARPLLAEGWRSDRSLRAIRINLKTAERFTQAALAQDPERLRAVSAVLTTARAIAQELEAEGTSLGQLAADPQRRSRLVLLRDAVGSARELSGPALAEALGVTVGFNSRDGD